MSVPTSSNAYSESPLRLRAIDVNAWLNYDVIADGVVVGRIMKAAAAPVGMPWMWTLIFGHHEDRTPTHGYEATREAAKRKTMSGEF